MPHLEPLPDQRATRILVASCVRKPPVIVQAWLDHLAAQDLPANTELHWCFINDNVEPESTALLEAFLDARHGTLMAPEGPAVGGYNDQHPVTHQWSGDAMERMGVLKDAVLDLARQEDFDYVWFVDADVLCGPTTLRSLTGCDVPIACAVFWTRWSQTREAVPLPQVWLRHPYQLDGRGLTQAEFLSKLMARHRVQVWGQGACTLIRRDALAKGVSFARLPDIKPEGMMAGEDRHFCLRAERLHVPMYADAWPEVFHVYHSADMPQIDAMRERLSDIPDPDDHPEPGDEVSLVLHAIEPVPTGPQQLSMVAPVHVRGDFARLALHPTLQEAVCGMQRGSAQIVPVVFQNGHPALQGQKRLIKVTLVDFRSPRPPIGVEV